MGSHRRSLETGENKGSFDKLLLNGWTYYEFAIRVSLLDNFYFVPFGSLVIVGLNF